MASTANAPRSWPFAPLDPEAPHSPTRKQLRGIVFDVDGTMCEPQNYMFQEMRDALNIPKSIDILDHIESLSPPWQAEAHEKIEEIERRAMRVQKPQPGLGELMAYLDGRGVRKAICTRNFNEPVDHLLRTFIPEHVFSPVVNRSFKPPKPDPAGILHIASTWGVPAGARGTDLIMVGDSADDMTAGTRAGAVTVLLESDFNRHLKQHESTSFSIARLDELIRILETGVCDRI